jgi:Sigma-70, region 4
VSSRRRRFLFGFFCLAFSVWLFSVWLDRGRRALAGGAGAAVAPWSFRQRSVVILKDVLDQSLEEIAAMFELTASAVKRHVARGRARLKEINAQAPAQPAPRLPSPDVVRYVALFNRRDCGLSAMLD